MPKYKLNSGEVIDTSNFSEEEENNWLFDNMDNIDLNYDFQNGAAGTDASATPVNNPASNGDSISEDGLSDGVNSYDDARARRIKEGRDYNFYKNNPREQRPRETDEAYQERIANTLDPLYTEFQEQEDLGFFEGIMAAENNRREGAPMPGDNPEEYADRKLEAKRGYTVDKSGKQVSLAPQYDYKYYGTTDKEIAENIIIDEELSEEFQNLAYNEFEDNTFVENYYDTAALKEIGVNISDFQGFLNVNEFSKDFENDVKDGVYSNDATVDGTYYTDSDNKKIRVQKEAALFDMLSTYMASQDARTNKRIALDGVIKGEKEYSIEDSQDPSKYKYTNYEGSKLQEYEDNNFSELKSFNSTQRAARLKEAALREGKISDGSDYLMPDFLEKAYDGLRAGFLDTATWIADITGDDVYAKRTRLIKSAEEQSDEDAALDYLYTSGLGLEIDGKTYIKQANGTISNITDGYNISDILPAKQAESISKRIDEEGKEMSDYDFMGGVRMSGDVIGNIIFQILGQKGTGLAIKGGGSLLLRANALANGFKGAKGLAQYKKTLALKKGIDAMYGNTRFRSIKKVINPEVVNATVFQSLYGASVGNEATIQAAKKAGLSDAEAEDLSEIAMAEMALLYAVTGPINPRINTMRALDNFIGKSGAIKKLVRDYSRTGSRETASKGFKNTIKRYANGAKEFGIRFGQAGTAETIQENIQQGGEFLLVNESLNKEVGFDILKNTYGQNDFVNTTVLSFVAGGLLGGAANVKSGFKPNPYKRLQKLLYAGKDIDITRKKLQSMVSAGTATQDQMDAILNDVEAVSANVNTMPDWMARQTPEEFIQAAVIANDISKLENKKKQYLESFSPSIDEQIKEKKAELDSVVQKAARIATEKEATIVKKILDKKGAKVENGIGQGSRVETFSTTDELLKADKNADPDADAYFDPKTGQIIINLEVAAKTQAVSAASHELLHKVLKSEFETNQEISKIIDEFKAILGKTDSVFLNKDGKQTTVLAEIENRLNNSYSKEYLEQNKDEWLTAFSDMIAKGEVDFNSVGESNWVKIGRAIANVLKGKGWSNIGFKTGQDVFDFVRDYQSNLQSGKVSRKSASNIKKGEKASSTNKKLSKSRKLTEAEEDRMEAIDQEIDAITDELMLGEIDQNTHDRRIAKLEEEYENIENPPKVEAKPKPKAKRKAKSDIDAPQASKKDEQSLSDVTAKSKKKLDAVGNNPEGFDPNDPVIYETLDGMIRSKAKAFKTAGNNIVNLTNLPGFEMDNMVSETLTSLIPYIKKFDPAKNDSLFGYVMAQLGNRMRGSLKTGRVTENTFTEDVTAAKNITAEESSNEVKEKPKYRSLTDAGVVSGEVIKAVKAKLKTVLRTLKSRVDAAITNNRTVTPLIAEIQFEMGKQADIDLKKAMGGKKDGKLRKFLLSTKKATLQNMTTTWLMGKDGQGGIPQAIQKKVDGKWVSYPAWVGKKIDREKTSTDDAGRTSGALLVRRHPNIVNYKNVDEVIDNDTYLAQFLDETGNPIRGRKEALAKAMAEEISFEIFSADLANPASAISEAFENNQERLGVEIAENFLQRIERDVDRGNIKFSKGKIKGLKSNKVIGKINKALKALINEGAAGYNTYLDTIEDKDIAGLVENYFDSALWKAGLFADNRAKNRGIAYEKFIKKVISSSNNKDIKVRLIGNKPGKGGDILLTLGNTKIQIELKLNDNAQIGSFTANYDNNTLIFSKPEISDSVGVDAMYKELNSKAYKDKIKEYNRIGLEFAKEKGYRAEIKNGKLYASQEVFDFLVVDKHLSSLNFQVDSDQSIIEDLYNKEGVYYIDFGNKGLFYLGEDVNGLGVPQLKAEVMLYARMTRSSANSSGLYTSSIRVFPSLKGNIKESSISLSDPKNISKVLKAAVDSQKILEGITSNEAIKNGNKYSKSPKGISVFDFDDTLARTKSNVLYVMPGDPSKVTEKEFSNLSKQEKVYYHGTSAVVDQKFVNKEIVKDFPEGASSFSVQMQGLGKHYTKSLDNAKSFIDHRNREDNTGTVAAVSISANNPKQFKTYQDLLNDIKSTVKNKDISISERNKEYLNILKSEGFDSIIYKEGPSYNPGKKSLMAEAVIPFNSAKKLIGSADYNQRNEGIVQGSAVAVKQGKLNAAQFAAKSEAMLEQGAEFDFSEFSKVMKGELGPLFSEAQKKEGKYTNKDIFVLTARPANSAKAIHEFLKSEGLNIPLKNITGLGNGSPKAKADWMVGKIAEGYNDFYFADDHLGNVKAVGKALKGKGVKGQTELSIVDFKNQPKAVRDILNTFDVKGPTQRSRVKFSKSMNKSMNDMLERASGIPSRKRLTRVEASELGKKKGRFKLWMPSTLDDFRGLTAFTFAGKGKQGEQDQKFFEDFLIRPYFRGVGNIDRAKQSLKNGFTALNKQYKPVLKKLGKKIPGMAYTHDQALRVYLWNKAGYEIPGLTRKQERELVRFIETDADLLAYANGALRVSQRKQWSKPDDYWNAQTILSDLNNFTEKAGRKEYLEEFIQNVDLIFSENNLNKIEAVYGKDHRQALENIIERMKSGVNRTQKSSANKNENAFNKWLNNSIGAIMFFNRRSALLQTLSTVNFVNWSDNNPLKAAQAFANQKQFWEDFVMIFNSPKLKQRRSGLNSDVNAAEIASAVTGAKDKATAALSYLLKLGFTPTQMVDSFAIASGGATFYRNRLNTYLAEVDADGKKVYTEKQAKEKAFEDFSLISDETQQSGDPALISSDQAGTLGRVVLNFMNTPIQLNRSIKKSYLDIVNRRRTPGYTQAQSDFSNVSKMVYYGFIQNAIFSTLQAGLFALIPGFNDDDEEKTEEELQAEKDKKWLYTLNSMLDTTLKGGFGIPGAVVSTIKNVIIEWNKQNDRGFMADDSKTLLAFLNLSPAVGSKARKINSAIKTERYERDVISERGFDVTIDGKFNLSPAWNAAGNLVEGAINIPLARVVDEVNSITEALDSRNTVYQRIALALGWKSWAVGAKNEENDLIKVVSKYKKKLDNKKKAAEERKNKKKAKIEAIMKANLKK